MAKMGKAALAIAAAIKATGAQRYRFRQHEKWPCNFSVGMGGSREPITIYEAYRADDHAFWMKVGKEGTWRKITPLAPVTMWNEMLDERFEVRVVPSK